MNNNLEKETSFSQTDDIYHETVNSMNKPKKDSKLNNFKNIEKNNTITNVMLFVTFLLCGINIILLGLHTKNDKKCFLGNGDHVTDCVDNPMDKTCFEVKDQNDRIIYRSQKDNRLLGFYKCSNSAVETQLHKCIGEYAFSYNSTIIWYHRLYHDTEQNKYSLISGPEDIGVIGRKLKYRHMLSYPYNYIISYDDIPPDTHPDVELYIKGRVLVDGNK